MSAAPPQTLPEGRLFAGRWQVGKCIRAGGMGTVYEVVHRETKARSALKVMLPELVASSELRARFKQEAMVTATLESDHIVKVFDGGTDMETGAPYLVMELLRGEDLGARVAIRGPLPAAEAVLLLRQASLAIERTHAAGIVHRDLKPENLFLTTRDDGSPLVKVLDFGIAKIIPSASRAETTRTVGTPLYMAPEQVRGDATIGAPADLYALGHIAYALLVGEAYWAFERKEHDSVYPLLMSITKGLVEPARVRAARRGRELPEAFDAWFAKATAVEPSDRFASVRLMIDELGRALEVVEAPRVSLVMGPPPEPPPSSRLAGPSVAGVSRDATPAPRKARALALGLGGAALLALAFALGWSRRAPAGEEPARAPASAVDRAVAAPAPLASASVAPLASATAAPLASASVAPLAAVRAPSPSRPKAAASSAPSAAPPPPRDPSDAYRGSAGP